MITKLLLNLLIFLSTIYLAGDWIRRTDSVKAFFENIDIKYSSLNSALAGSSIRSQLMALKRASGWSALVLSLILFVGMRIFPNSPLYSIPAILLVSLILAHFSLSVYLDAVVKDLMASAVGYSLLAAVVGPLALGMLHVLAVFGYGDPSLQSLHLAFTSLVHSSIDLCALLTSNDLCKVPFLPWVVLWLVVIVSALLLGCMMYAFATPILVVILLIVAVLARFARSCETLFPGKPLLGLALAMTAGSMLVLAVYF